MVVQVRVCANDGLTIPTFHLIWQRKISSHEAITSVKKGVAEDMVKELLPNEEEIGVQQVLHLKIIHHSSTML